MKIHIVETKYTININDNGRITSVRIEDSKGKKKVYKRDAMIYREEKLTTGIFERIAYKICKQDTQKFAEMKRRLRGDTAYYKVLQKVLKRVSNEYRKLIEE